MTFFRRYGHGAGVILLWLALAVAAYSLALGIAEAILNKFAASGSAAPQALAAFLTQLPFWARVLLHVGGFFSVLVAVLTFLWLSEHAGYGERWGVSTFSETLVLAVCVVVGLPWLVVFFGLAVLIGLPLRVIPEITEWLDDSGHYKGCFFVAVVWFVILLAAALAGASRQTLVVTLAAWISFLALWSVVERVQRGR
jgi:hypothetical protein